MNIFILFLIIVFILGIFFCIYKKPSTIEGFINTPPRCPNLLIQKGSEFYLYNTNLANVPGVNPIRFKHLEDYVEFLTWQKKVGITCPVLYLQHTYDTQSNSVYKIRPSVIEPQYGLPPSKPNKVYKLLDATRDDLPYNINSLPGIDTQDQNIGIHTPLDEMNDYSANYLNKVDNAMSPYWNPELAQKHIEQGVYADNEVQIRIT